MWKILSILLYKQVVGISEQYYCEVKESDIRNSLSSVAFILSDE